MTRKGYIETTREWLGDDDIVLASVDLRIHYLLSPGREAQIYGPADRCREAEPAEIELDKVQRAISDVGCRTIWPGVQGHDSWARQYLIDHAEEVFEAQASDDADAEEYRAELRADAGRVNAFTGGWQEDDDTSNLMGG